MIELTRKERIFLCNQYQIMEMLSQVLEKMGAQTDISAEYCRERAKALREGHVLHYDEEWFLDELDVDGCREVIDILEMFRNLHFTYNKLQNRDGLDDFTFSFSGFDGNNEPGQLFYAMYYIQDLGNYEEFKKLDLNSHAQFLPSYRRMLAAWKESKDRFNLTKEDLLRIQEAAKPPG